MATIKEIAKACNVSVATVSNVLNNKARASEATKKLVLDMVKELNYTPNVIARNLKTKSSRSIGVIVEDMTIFSIPDIVDGITELCEEENYQILLLNLRLFKKYNDTYYNRDYYFELVKEEINKLISKQVEGIIYVTAHERIIHCIPDDLPIPAVMAYGYTESGRIPSVVVDDENGAYQLVSAMIEKGHRKIGVITGKSDSIHAQQRLLGYQRALYDNGLLYNPALVCVGDWNRESGYAHTDEILRQGVTAIFSMNDPMAGGVYDRLLELGMTPGREISVAGYDDQNISGYYKPRLTTVRLPLRDIGYKAGQIVMEMLREKAESRKKGDAEEEARTETERQARVYSIPCYPMFRDSIKDLREDS